MSSVIGKWIHNIFFKRKEAELLEQQRRRVERAREEWISKHRPELNYALVIERPVIKQSSMEQALRQTAFQDSPKQIIEDTTKVATSEKLQSIVAALVPDKGEKIHKEARTLFSFMVADGTRKRPTRRSVVLSAYMCLENREWMVEWLTGPKGEWAIDNGDEIIDYLISSLDRAWPELPTFLREHNTP